jgi:hypothetical protein
LVVADLQLIHICLIKHIFIYLQGHGQVKRLKVVDLKSLWTRATKRPKPSIGSNSTPILQTVESNIQSDSPSVQLQTNNEIEVRPAVASTYVVPTTEVQEDQHDGTDDEFGLILMIGLSTV